MTGTLKKITATATLSVVVADLTAQETVSDATPYYYAPITFTTTVTNTSTTTTATDVIPDVNQPSALLSPVVAPSTGSYDTTSSTWTIGTLAPGASATLTMAGVAGDVVAGTQTVTATVTAATSDPVPGNNTASVSESSQPAPVAARITGPRLVDVCPDPPVIDTWTFSAVNAINPAAPPPVRDSYTVTQTCSTTPDVGCPTRVDGNIPNPSYVRYASNDFILGETYKLTILVTGNNDAFPPVDPNYEPNYSVTSFRNDDSVTTVCLG